MFIVASIQIFKHALLEKESSYLTKCLIEIISNKWYIQGWAQGKKKNPEVKI